jgi:TldD protein
MRFTRRQFLGGATALAGLGTLARARLVSARGGFYADSTLDELVKRALAAAKKAGATWADVRVVRRSDEGIATREDHVTGVWANESYGLGMRVIAGGAWGFAASSTVTIKEAERVAALAVDVAKANSKVLKTPIELAPESAYTDVWQTPLTKDPFKIALGEKAELLLEINAAAMKVPGVKFVSSSYRGLLEWKLFASSEGTWIEQEITRIAPDYSATAVDTATGEFESRAHELPARQAGWEYIEGSSLLKDAPKIGEEAVQKLKSPSVTPGKKDLILAPSNLWLTIHESVGHPTELDRAMGLEANFAGTSFATPDQLGKLKYAHQNVNLYADKTTEGGLATCGYDDDGVKTQRWDIVRNGYFVGYQTTREQAAWIGEKASRGTSYAQDYKSFPFQRMPNVSLAASTQKRSLRDLIAATDDGILITGNGSWSIDHQRKNFQFGGQMFHEVKRGALRGTLRDVAYQAYTLDFWNGCDMIGGADTWELHGTLSDGKGEPSQSNGVSHGCPPARFRNVNILNTNQRKKA